MTNHDTKALLAAVSGELSDIRNGVEQAGDLMGEVLAKLPSQEHMGFLARTQSFDVLVQRLEALSALAASLSNDEPMDTALAALPLAEMAERLQEAAHRGRVIGNDNVAETSGDLLLFD